MPIRIHALPNFAAFAFGGFFAVLAMAMLLLPATHKNSNEFVSHYGRALSAMAARQAVDAAFNHDLVRLQVILQDVVENPHTPLATIHDVENKLLVQAGKARGTPKQTATFTSPIILHDSIAGYVSVTIDASRWSPRSVSLLVSAFATLMLTLAAWSLFRSQAVNWHPQQLSTAENPENTSPSSETPYTNKLAAEPQDMVFAVIHIKNLNVLKQQLNGQSFRNTTVRLEKIISDVMALYGGHQFQLTENYYVLQFYTRQNNGESLFNASCSAYLILELAGIIDKVPLDLAALVSANENDIVPEKLPFAGLILEVTAASEALISRRIEFMDLGTNDGRRVLADFHQPFKALLENQLKQLYQIL